ncbi:MAG: hypothetical protein QXM16_00530 [Nitrososphaerota archaeon]
MRGDQDKPWEDVRKLRERSEKIQEEVRSLREAWEKLKKRIVEGFEEFASLLGVTYEIRAAAYIQVLLEELGYQDVRVGRGYVVKNGQVLEIDIFCENPLVVGEVTTRLGDEEEMNREIAKLLERVEAVSSSYRISTIPLNTVRSSS